MTYPPGQPQGWWQPQQPPQQGPPPPAAPHGPPGPPGRQPSYGGGFQSQYGGLGAFGAAPAPAPPKKGGRRRLLIGLAAVAVLAGGGAAGWLTAPFQGDVLDPESAQDGVVRVLRESYGEHDVSDAQCPADQEIRAGHTFECTVEVGGRPRTVSIRVLNDKPEFEIGAPR